MSASQNPGHVEPREAAIDRACEPEDPRVTFWRGWAQKKGVLREARAKAWATRRAKYGAQGHAGAYTRPRRTDPTACCAGQSIPTTEGH